MPRAVSTRALAALLLALAPIGCDDGSTDKAKDAIDKTAKNTKDAIDASQKAIDSGKKTAKQLKDTADDIKKKADDLKADPNVQGAAALAGKLLEDIPETGQLTDTAKQWLSDHSGEIEKVISTGVQVAPVAWEIAKVVNASVDKETVVEPIYMPVGEQSPANVDKAIKGMPRVEVIDGLTVGFKHLDSTDAKTNVKERAYLITWRDGDHIVGLVYRSRREIDVDTLVKEAPRLIKLSSAAIAATP